MALYPVTLDLADRKCLVVGGGRVAWRKVCSLRKASARVEVISPQLVPELSALVAAGDIEWREKTFAAEDLQGGFLVFAATDSPVVQQQIRKAARAAGVLVNMASEPAQGDFHVPGHFRRGDILVTVSTGGNSPAIASMLRKSLEEWLNPAYADAVSFFGVLRAEVLQNSDDSSSHGQLFSALLQDGLVEYILAGEWDAVLALLDSRLPEGIDGRRLVENFLAGEKR